MRQAAQESLSEKINFSQSSLDELLKSGSQNSIVCELMSNLVKGNNSGSENFQATFGPQQLQQLQFLNELDSNTAKILSIKFDQKKVSLSSCLPC